MIAKADIVAALREAGVQPGTVVFSHANIAMFGPVEDVKSMPQLIETMLSAFAEALGDDGTLVLPVFTYSFGSDKAERIFDVQKTMSTTSAMGNTLIDNSSAYRSHDPMLSVVATGRQAEALTGDIDPVCFGSDSIWARLHQEDALICNLNLDSGSTFLHWVEREAGVSYRSDIPMSGTLIDAGQARHSEVIYSGRDLNDPDAVPAFEAYHAACVEHGVSKIVPLGRGQIVAQRARAAKEILERLWHANPNLLNARHDA